MWHNLLDTLDVQESDVKAPNSAMNASLDTAHLIPFCRTVKTLVGKSCKSWSVSCMYLSHSDTLLCCGRNLARRQCDTSI